MNQIHTTGSETNRCIHMPLDEPNGFKRILRFLFWKSKRNTRGLGEVTCARCGIPLQAPAVCCWIPVKLMYMLFACAVTWFSYEAIFPVILSPLGLLGMLFAMVLAGLFLFDRVMMALLFAFGRWRPGEAADQDANNRRFVAERQKTENMMYMGCQIAVAQMLGLRQAYFIPVYLLFALMGVRGGKRSRGGKWAFAAMILAAAAVFALSFWGILPEGISDMLSFVVAVILVLGA